MNNFLGRDPFSRLLRNGYRRNLQRTIEAGKRAAMILLDANPLDDIHNIRKIVYVVANGKMYESTRLWTSVG